MQDDRFEIVFASLSITPAKMSEIFTKVSNWTMLQLPNSPATMQVRAGETVALDLFYNTSTGQKVTDYLTIKGKGSRTPLEVRGPARDSAADDALIEISSPELSVDGAKITSVGGGVSGQSVWVDVPGTDISCSPWLRGRISACKGLVRSVETRYLAGRRATIIKSKRTSRSHPDPVPTTYTCFTSRVRPSTSACPPDRALSIRFEIASL